MSRELIERTKGKWRAILATLGIPESYLTGKQGPCPMCDGKSRFRFDDKSGSGSWICNHCGSGYTNETGNDLNNLLTLVISLSELPVSGISNYCQINGEDCTIDWTSTPSDPDAPGPGFRLVTDYDKKSDSDYNHEYCWVKFYPGTQTTADSYLTTEFGSDPDKPWSSDMIGRGCAYIVVVCRYSKKGVWSGIPQFKFVLQGIPLYNPKKDSTNGGSGSHRWNNRSTWEFSENPKVMQYNVIRGISYSGDWVWGGQDDTGNNSGAYRLPTSYWIPAITHCDENVTVAAGGTINRYTAGCEIHVDQQPIDIIKELDKACAGYTTEYGGLWKTWCGPAGSSVMSFTDADIIITEDQTDNLSAPIQSTFNGARATYVNQNNGWVMKDAPPRIFNDLQTEDGGLQLIADIQLPYVTNGNQAQRLMRAAVLDSRKQITHTMQMPPEAYFLEPFDVVNWNSARNGYVNKKFMVTSIEDLPNCNQLVSLREINPSDYDWDVSYELPESVGTFKPIRPAALALDFTVAADQVDSASGKDRPAIAVSWTWNAPDIDVRFVKYEVRLDGKTKVIAHGTFRNVEDTTRTITSSVLRFGKKYNVRLFAEPERTWRGSSWTGWKDVTCVIVDVPAAPTLTRIIQKADDGTQLFFLDIGWTAVTADVKYVAKVVSDGVTKRYVADDNSLRIPVVSGKTYVVSVAAKGNDQTVGDFSPTASITIAKKNINDVPNVTGLSINPGHRRNKIDYDDVDDDVFTDYRTTCIWRSLTTTRPTNPYKRTKAGYFVDDAIAIGTPYFYWAAHKDKSGQIGAIAGPVSSAAVKIQAGDYAAGSIVVADTSTTAPATPSAPTVTQGATDINGDGTIDMVLVLSGSLPAGAVSLEFEVDFNVGGTADLQYFPATGAKTRIGPVIAGKLYSVKVRGVSFNGLTGGLSPPTTKTPAKRTLTLADPTFATAQASVRGFIINWDWSSVITDPTYDYTEIQRREWEPLGGGYVTTWATIAREYGNRYFDPDPVYKTAPNEFYYAYQIRHVDTSGNPTAWLGIFITDRYYLNVKSQDIMTGAVRSTSIDNRMIHDTTRSATNTSQTVPASNTLTAEALGVTFPLADCGSCDIWAEFRNNSGGVRKYDVTIEDANTVGASILKAWPSVTLADDGYFGQKFTHTAPAASSATYRLRITGTGTAGTVIRTLLEVKMEKR